MMVIINEYLNRYTSKKAAGTSTPVFIRNVLMALSMLLMAVVASPSVHAQQHLAQEEVILSQAEIDQILAPIALYPDSLLTHILIASTYPLEVVQANRWVQENSNLNSDQILRRAEERNWDPSIQALTAFPDLLQRMSDNLEWTQILGDTFLYDEEYVLRSIQNLRHKAYEYGSLDNLRRIRVVTDGNYIILEPFDHDVVYVPYYDVAAVYGPWLWHEYPPVNLGFGYHYRGLSFIWGKRIRVGSRISFTAFSWKKRYVVRSNRSHFYRKSYVKRKQILSHFSSKRWVHNPIHRRNIYYSHARVNKRYTPNRVYRPSSRFSYGNRTNRQRIVNQRRVSNFDQRFNRQRVTQRAVVNQTANRAEQLRQNTLRDNQSRNNRDNQSRNNNLGTDRNANRTNRVLSTGNNNRFNNQRQNNNARNDTRSNNQNSRLINQRNNQNNSRNNSQSQKRTVKLSNSSFKKQNNHSLNSKVKQSSSSSRNKFSTQKTKSYSKRPYFGR